MQKRDEQRQQLLREVLLKRAEEDEVDVFMKSIAMAVKKLPPDLVGKAKLQILSVVTELSQSASVSTQFQNEANCGNNSDTYSYFNM